MYSFGFAGSYSSVGLHVKVSSIPVRSWFEVVVVVSEDLKDVEAVVGTFCLGWRVGPRVATVCLRVVVVAAVVGVLRFKARGANNEFTLTLVLVITFGGIGLDFDFVVDENKLLSLTGGRFRLPLLFFFSGSIENIV